MREASSLSHVALARYLSGTPACPCGGLIPTVFTPAPCVGTETACRHSQELTWVVGFSMVWGGLQVTADGEEARFTSLGPLCCHSSDAV